MFNFSDQLTGSFEELMQEIRAMRRELERIRKAVEAQAAVPTQPVRAKAVRSHRGSTPGTRPRSTAA
jgi:hypothetical protein